MAYPLRYQPDPSTNRSVKILFFANTDWYLYNFRLPLARHLRDQGHEVVMLSPPGPYVARLQAAGFRALTVPMQRRSLNPLRELALFQHIRQLYAPCSSTSVSSTPRNAPTSPTTSLSNAWSTADWPPV